MISILRRVGLLQKLVEKKLEKESQFYLNNRNFVLSSYRFLLKNIPTIYERKLQQKQKINELQNIFRAQKILSSLDETKYKSQKLRKIIQAIKDKNYDYIGQFQISLYNQSEDISIQLQTYNKKFTLDKKRY